MKNKIILPAILLGLSLLCGCTPEPSTMIRPPFLKPGDKVAIVAPSYRLQDSLLVKACDCLSFYGFEPVAGPHVSDRYPDGDDTLSFYAGPTEERVADLKWALADSSIKAIICARGGYGAIQDLQEMSLADFRRHPKWIVGYSDITALHMASVKAGVMSIHGNMCSNLGANGLDEVGNDAMLRLLSGRMPQYDIPANGFNSCGKAQGTLIGGNMITLISLLGSEFDCLDGRDCILFVEEVGESMHAIDRLFNMLKLQDRMKDIKGIVFGDFTDCGEEFAWSSVEEMLHGYTAGLGIPVAYGFTAGHGDLNLPLVEGATVTLTVTPDGAHLE